MQRIYTREMTETEKKIFAKKNENLLTKDFAKIFLKREIFAKEKKEGNFAEFLSEGA